MEARPRAWMTLGRAGPPSPVALGDTLSLKGEGRDAPFPSPLGGKVAGVSRPDEGAASGSIRFHPALSEAEARLPAVRVLRGRQSISSWPRASADGDRLAACRAPP